MACKAKRYESHLRGGTIPYIEREKRPDLDHYLDPLIKHLQSLDVEDQDGALNYSITKAIKQIYPEKYFHYNRALGVLSAVEHELYRRKIGPYENRKLSDNGDV